MEALLVRFGPLAVLLGAAVEGDVTMILAGVTVHLGLLAAPLAFGAGLLGAFASDAVFFSLGRHGGARIRQTNTYRRVAPTVERIAHRLGAPAIVLARLIYGTRIASMVFWGLQGIGWTRFALFDVIGCALWAAILGGIGYALSNSAGAVVGRVKAVERRLLGLLLVATALVLVVRVVSRRRLSRGPAVTAAPDARSSAARGRRRRS